MLVLRKLWLWGSTDRIFERCGTNQIQETIFNITYLSRGEKGTRLFIKSFFKCFFLHRLCKDHNSQTKKEVASESLSYPWSYKWFCEISDYKLSHRIMDTQPEGYYGQKDENTNVQTDDKLLIQCTILLRLLS